MKKRVVTLLLVAAMTGSMVVGCGSNSNSDTKSETKTESTDTKTEEKKSWQTMSISMYLLRIQRKLTEFTYSM